MISLSDLRWLWLLSFGGGPYVIWEPYKIVLSSKFKAYVINRIRKGMVVWELERRETEWLFVVYMNMTIGDRLTSLHMVWFSVLYRENGRDWGGWRGWANAGAEWWWWWWWGENFGFSSAAAFEWEGNRKEWCVRLGMHQWWHCHI